MPEETQNDALHKNFANGRESPFKRLPDNEMMLMTDRRVRQFLTRVLAALNPEQAKRSSWDSDLTPIHFFDITQDPELQWQHYSEYERPWEHSVFPALKDSISARWEECLAANPNKTTSLTGEKVAENINTVILRRFNVPMDGIRTIAIVTTDNPAFQNLRDHFSQTVAPYKPKPEYDNLVYGNVWQSMIADCMHRRDLVSLWHILAEGKKQAPEALSDAIAFMILGISWCVTCPETFEKGEVQILAACMPCMIFSKENTSRALHNVLSYRKIYDEYGLYDAALELVIKNPELQMRDMGLGCTMENWSFEEVEELTKRLTQWGFSSSYLIGHVFYDLVDCRQDVWERLETLLPADMTERDHRVWNIFKDMRKISCLEKLDNWVEISADEVTVDMPLWLHFVQNAQHTLTPYPLKITRPIADLPVLPDFHYTKPEPSSFATWHQEVPQKREEIPRSGYRFVALVQSPEEYTWIKLPNHTHHDPQANIALIALTPDNQSRFFPFSWLDADFQASLIKDFPIEQHELPKEAPITLS